MSRSVSTEMKMRETAILFAKAEIYQPTNNPLAGKKRFQSLNHLRIFDKSTFGSSTNWEVSHGQLGIWDHKPRSLTLCSLYSELHTNGFTSSVCIVVVTGMMGGVFFHG